LVVFPTDTVYGIAADAFDPGAVQRLLDVKGRGRQRPAPVLAASAEQAFGLASSVPEGARALADACWPGALTLILPARPEQRLDLGDKNDTVALRVPALPFALRLLEATGPLAVSSANLSGAPPATSCGAAQQMLGDAVAIYLDGGSTPGDVPSSIVDFASSFNGRLIREGAITREDLGGIWPSLDSGVADA
jgi:tRNA threonylcarbamoyl adenosine modification protein (Sua5/YciO/YrdC/YwlC family)